MTGILLSLTLLAVAQQDEKAKQILNKVSEKTRANSSISAEFIFSMDNDEMDIHEKNEGSIQLKGQKYVVNLPDVGIKVFSDGETLWNYMADGNQVTISNIEDSDSELMDPSTIFNIYEKGFRSKYVDEKKKGNKTLYEIELYPDKEKYDVTKIALYIDKSNMMINSAQLFGTDGNLYGVEVTGMVTDTALPDSYFVFNTADYEDIEIIDFR